MSRLPTITDPGYAPSQTTFGLTEIGTQPAPQPLGMGIAGLVGELAEGAEKLGASIVETQRKRKLIDYETRSMTALGEALEAASKAPDGQAKAIFENKTAGLLAELQQEPDSIVRDAAVNSFKLSKARTAVQLGRDLAKQEVVKFGANLEASGENMLRGVAAGTTTKEEALERYTKHAKSGVGLVWSDDEADALIASYGGDLDKAESVAVRGQLLEGRIALTERWARAESDERRQAIEDHYEMAVEDARAMNAIDAVQAAELMAGFHASARAQADEEVNSLSARAYDAAALGDTREIDELETRLRQMPDSQDRKRVEAAFARYREHAKTVKGGAQRFLDAVKNQTWPENPPQDDDSINSAQETMLRSGSSEAAVASLFVQNGSRIGRSLDQAIGGLSNQGDPRFDLNKFADVLQSVAMHDRDAAARIAGGGPAPKVGRALWYAIDNQSGFDSAKAIDLLSHDNATMQLKEVGPLLEPESQTAAAAVYKLFKDALGDDASSEEYAILQSNAQLSYLALAQGGDRSAPPDRMKAAVKLGVETYLGQRTRVDTFPGRQWPVDFGDVFYVQRNRLPTDMDSFNAQMAGNSYSSPWWPFSGHKRHLRPDLIIRHGDKFYVPDIVQQRVASIMEFDDNTGETNFIDPGDDLFQTLNATFTHGQPAGQIDWLADLRWHEGIPSKYMMEADRLTQSDRAIRLRNDVQTELTASGRLRGLSIADQRKAIADACLLEAQARGWIGIDAPTKTAEPTP